MKFFFLQKLLILHRISGPGWAAKFLFYFILFYFILFYFILFYFILFYFILFYFILFYLNLFIYLFFTPQVSEGFFFFFQKNFHAPLGYQIGVPKDLSPTFGIRKSMEVSLFSYFHGKSNHASRPLKHG